MTKLLYRSRQCCRGSSRRPSCRGCFRHYQPVVLLVLVSRTRAKIARELGLAWPEPRGKRKACQPTHQVQYEQYIQTALWERDFAPVLALRSTDVLAWWMLGMGWKAPAVALQALVEVAPLTQTTANWRASRRSDGRRHTCRRLLPSGSCGRATRLVEAARRAWWHSRVQSVSLEARQQCFQRSPAHSV